MARATADRLAQFVIDPVCMSEVRARARVTCGAYAHYGRIAERARSARHGKGVKSDGNCAKPDYDAAGDGPSVPEAL